MTVPDERSVAHPDEDPLVKGALVAQRRHWDTTFAAKPDMFGQEPSYPATVAARFFTENTATRTILDLGCGQGRDALFFAQRGLRVVAVDYSNVALDELRAKAETLGLATAVETIRHDVRMPLPFADETLDASYAHMLYCMALTQSQLVSLSREVRRVLKPGGLSIYTVRNTHDPDFGVGIHHAEKLYEDEGFVVHFFDRELVGRLADGFDVVNVEEFEEGALPRRLFLVTMRKRQQSLELEV